MASAENIRKLKALWDQNPPKDDVIGYNLYYRLNYKGSLDPSGNPGNKNEPFGVYLWKDNNRWHLHTTYAPRAFEDNYAGTKIEGLHGDITQAEYYSAESSNETITWDAKQIVVDSMAVNGTGGIDGVDFNGDFTALRITVVFNGDISPQNIFIGAQRMNPDALVFTVGQDMTWKKVNTDDLIPPDQNTGWRFTLDVGSAHWAYFVLTAVNKKNDTEFNESGYSNEVAFDLVSLPAPSNPENFIVVPVQ